MIFWLLLDFVSLISLSFFSMFEMAAISFDRVKVDYYVARGYRRIIWLKELLAKPSVLFGTTLVGVNLSLVFGAECSRNLFYSLHLSPDWAPLVQITLAIILGELAPMFAARAHPEHVVFLGMPIIYTISQILSPFLRLIEYLSRLGNHLVGGHTPGDLTFIPREELVELLEGTDRSIEPKEEEGSRRTLSAIFSLSEEKVSALLKPMETFPSLSLKATVGDLRNVLAREQSPYFLLKAEGRGPYVGWVAIRDLLRVPDNRRVRDWMRQPLVVDQNSTLLSLLNTFRKEDIEIVVGIDEKGTPVGYLTFEELILYLFPVDRGDGKRPTKFVDRTFEGTTLLRTVQEELEVSLGLAPDLSLSEFVEEHLGDHPEEGSHFVFGGFHWQVVSHSLLKVERVRIKTLPPS